MSTLRYQERSANNLTPGSEPALVVDVDGTLVRTDLLWEGLIQMVIRHPFRLGEFFSALLRGKAATKAHVARYAETAVDLLPLAPAVMKLIQEAREKGRPVILASAAHETQVVALARRVGADLAWGSTDVVNLAGATKLERICTTCPAFDYVGNAAPDLRIWPAARTAYAVNASRFTLRRARQARPDLIVLPVDSAPWRAWVRAVRPHQWSKNVLLLLPALAAHLAWTAELGFRLLAGLAAFCLAASAVYILNDIADLPHDRRHLTKRRRPFAAGELTTPAGLAMASGLGTTALAMGLWLSMEFLATLMVYLVLTSAYSFGIKRQPVLDVLMLATLYTIRVVAGAALVAVPLSRWFLAFSVFLFLSLALVKRVVELQRKNGDDPELLAGRGYAAADLPILTALGTAATLASALVYCLYITGEDVGRLYTRPDLLWAGLPVLLYWQARIWLMTGRKTMHRDDPVVFALRDRVSHIVLGTFLLIVVLAA